MIIIQKIKSLVPSNNRTFKNFGHRRQPIPLVTTIWHGFLTFTFIGLCLEWETLKRFILEDKEENPNSSLNTKSEVNNSM